jgi:hypothetical protein
MGLPRLTVVHAVGGSVNAYLATDAPLLQVDKIIAGLPLLRFQTSYGHRDADARNPAKDQDRMAWDKAVK